MRHPRWHHVCRSPPKDKRHKLALAARSQGNISACLRARSECELEWAPVVSTGGRLMSRNLFWLSDEQWERIKPHLPTDVRGVARADDRRVISGIIHVLKSGCRWCDCPEAYGPPTTVYNRFVRWARRGVWENLFRKLAGNGLSADTQMIDSTHVKAHRSASGGKGGRKRRLLAARAEGATRRSTHSRMLAVA
jgi:transposase